MLPSVLLFMGIADGRLLFWVDVVVCVCVTVCIVVYSVVVRLPLVLLSMLALCIMLSRLASVFGGYHACGVCVVGMGYVVMTCGDRMGLRCCWRSCSW